MKVDCPNCDCSFNETCFPVSLQCSHVYCIECVKKFTHNFTVEEISCPACVNPVRAPTNISECEQNTIILGLIKPEKADAKQAECSECDQMCSTSCIDCPKKPSMCSSCFTLMHQTAKRESHKLGPLVKQYTCSIHGKELDLICHSCSSAVCQLCVIVGSHVGHQVTFPADISQYTKKIPKAIQKFEQDVALSKQDLLEKQVVVAQQECNIEILKKAASCTDSIEFILQYGRMIPVEAKILMLGLDGSGKTTLLYHLVLEDVVTTIPTIGFNVETVVKQFHRFTIWDVGGQEKLRPLWRHYFSSTQGLIFVIDCSRRDRVEEAREELFGLLQKEGLRGIPVLVCANKQDIPGAMTVSELSEKLGLARISHLKYNILPVSSSAGEGLTTGLLWLASQTVC